MSSRDRLAIVTGLFVLAVLAAVGAGLAPAVLAQDDTNETDNESYGTQVSSFMQASASDSAHSADTGMFAASVNESEDPNETVDDRVDQLKERRTALENRTAELRQEYEDGTVSEAAYQAEASSLRAQIANLNVAVDHANRTAQSHGVNNTKLDTLRSHAANMTGPEVSTIARNLTDVGGGPPADTPGSGQPEDAGPDENGPGESSPDDAGPPEDTETPDDSSSADQGDQANTPDKANGSTDTGSNGGQSADTDGQANQPPATGS